jgi:hypothetical protein
VLWIDLGSAATKPFPMVRARVTVASSLTVLRLHQRGCSGRECR